MEASALCPVPMLSLFITADNHICRCGFGVFPVWAVTIILAGCDHDTLGLKRARRGESGKRRIVENHDFYF